MIELTEITPALIGTFLKAYQSDPDSVLESVSGLQWMAHYPSPHERAFQLFYRLEAWTLEELETESRQAGLPLPLDSGATLDPAAFLRASFSCKNGALQKWAAVYLRYFMTFPGTMKVICTSAGINIRRFYRRRDEGLAALTRLVVLAEVQARQEIQSIRLFDRLPLRHYGTLIGRERIVLELRQMFDDPHGPRMISLEGLAGIGKTAIARQLAADLAHYNLMGGLAWVNVSPVQVSPVGRYEDRPDPACTIPDIINAIMTQLGSEDLGRGLPPEEQVARLRDRLLTPYYLVVLDGLEALDDVGRLLALLRPLTLRVLFVLTSRRSLGIHEGVAIIPVRELPESQYARMLQEECARYQVNCALPPQQTHLLHEFSAGSPGFLRLIAEQFRKNTAHTVLDFIERRQLPDDLLDKLSHWFEPQLLHLSPDPVIHADSLLVIIALCCAVPNGDTRAWLQHVTGLPDERYFAAENALAAHYFLIRHAAPTFTNEVHAPPILRAYLLGQLLRLWKTGLWTGSHLHRRKLRWLARIAVRLRRTLRATAAYLDQVDRATLLDGREMDRYYALLHAAHYWESLAEPAIDIILKLHPLPIYNGDWPVWQDAIVFAVNELGRRGRIPQQAKLLADLQVMRFHAGLWDEVKAIFTRLLALGGQHGQPSLIARALYVVVDACLYLEQHAEVEQYLALTTESPVIASAAGDEAQRTRVWLALVDALILREQGLLADAMRQVEEAEAHARRCATLDNAMLGQIRQHQGLMRWVNGHYVEAEEYLHEALGIFGKHDDIFSQSFVEGNLGLLYWSMGQLGEAENHIRGSIHTARLHGAEWHLTAETGNLVLVMLYRGELVAALERADEHFQLATRMNATHEIYRATVNRGAIYFHLNRIQDAIEALKKGLAIRGLSPMGRACCHLYLARCYAARGKFSTAAPYLEYVQQVVDDTGSLPLQVILNRVRAETTPDRPQARAWLQTALVLAEDLKRDYDRAACLLALAAVQDSREKQLLYWDSGKGALTIADAARWLAGTSLRRPPRLPTLM